MSQRLCSLHCRLEKNRGISVIGELFQKDCYPKLLRFIVVGVLTALSYMGLITLFANVLELSPVVSVFIAYPLAVIFNYLAHYLWTFKSDLPHSVSFSRFLLVNALFYLINLLATDVVAPLLGMDFLPFQLVVTCSFAAATFVIQKLWVFCRS
jgi:putative flippase GtrA